MMVLMSVFMPVSMCVSSNRKSTRALISSRFLFFMTGFITALNPITHDVGYKIEIYICNQKLLYPFLSIVSTSYLWMTQLIASALACFFICICALRMTTWKRVQYHSGMFKRRVSSNLWLRSEWRAV